MMRSNRSCAAAAALKSHALYTPCERKTGVRMVCAARAICEPLRRQMVDSTASSCTVAKTVRNDA
eukprot:4222959-Lingulodinium_polyedra.AAC.1